MASRGINKAIIVGNLGNHPEVRYTASGAGIANVSVATSYAYRNKETGEQVEQTEWHRVVFFGRLAEIVGEYLRKGSKIYVEGRIQTRKWQDKEGHDRYTTEIVANEMQMLDSRESGQANTNTAAPLAPAGTTPPATPVAPTKPTPEQGEKGSLDDFDDDIPF